MITIKDRPKTVSEYINAASPEARKKLREMRKCIRAAAPGAREEIEVGYAGVLAPENPGDLRGIQKAHWVLSHPVGRAGLYQGAGRIQVC